MRQELLAVLRRHAGRRVKGNGNVWRLDGCSAAVEECKTELLETICALARPVVHYDEPPTDIAALRDADDLGADTWRLPLHAPGATVLAWLSMGNWQLWVVTTPIAAVPDLCRASDTEVEQFLAETGVLVVIDSFHDDVSWVVGLGGSESHGRLAG